MQNLEISKDSLLEKDVTTEKEYLYTLELSFQNEIFEQNLTFHFHYHYAGKHCMCVSFESESLLCHGDVFILVKLTEGHFVQKKKLREVGWCANYMMDKRENKDFLVDFVFINYSPNQRKVDEQQPTVDLELCNYFFL